MIDYTAIKKAAENYEKDMTSFLRELIAIPSESAEEEGVAKRIVKEMEQLGFDEAFIDKMGNVHGVMGKGEKIIAFDGHIDTVGLGELSNWKFDPYKGYENDTEIGGRGGSDQTGGVVSAVYGAKIMKDLGLIPEGYKVLVTGTVQDRVRRHHRADRSGHLSRSPRPHGDPRRGQGRILPRLRSRARR